MILKILGGWKRKIYAGVDTGLLRGLGLRYRLSKAVPCRGCSANNILL